MRVETGPLQFGKDWPGFFIRGDNALYYGHQLEILCDEIRKAVIAGNLNPQYVFFLSVLDGLAKDLQMVKWPAPEAIIMKPYAECIVSDTVESDHT